VPTEVCPIAVLYAESTLMSIIQLTDIFLSTISIVLFIFNVVGFKKIKTTVHFNFKINIVNAAILGLLHAVFMLITQLRNQIMYRIYKDPCELLVPTWIVLILRGPGFIYVFGMPIVHFCAFAERALATFFVKKYEAIGNWLGWIFTSFTWTTTLLVNYYIFRDEDFLARKTYLGVTSENSAPKILKMHLLVLFFDFVTTLGDIGLYGINKKQKSSRVMDYSLSKSYQLNENTAALKLLLPLSLCHSICFLLYLLLNLSAREFGNNLDYVEFMASLEGTYMLIPIHINAMFAMMIIILRKKSEPFELRRPSDNTTLDYFNHLRRQWGIKIPLSKDSEQRFTRRHFLRDVGVLYKRSEPS